MCPAELVDTEVVVVLVVVGESNDGCMTIEVHNFNNNKNYILDETLQRLNLIVVAQITRV